jgi:hypothetical protein
MSAIFLCKYPDHIVRAVPPPEKHSKVLELQKGGSITDANKFRLERSKVPGYRGTYIYSLGVGSFLTLAGKQEVLRAHHHNGNPCGALLQCSTTGAFLFEVYNSSIFGEPQIPKTPTAQALYALVGELFLRSPSRALLTLVTKTISYDCKDTKRIGGKFQRTKLPEGSWPVCFDTVPAEGAGCRVFSVGIDNDFSFDDGMATHGCIVDSFDPSMSKPDFQHAPHVKFHNMGLSAVDGNIQGTKMGTNQRQQWKVRSLGTLMSSLDAPTVDVLKVDVEGAELEVLEALTRDNEGQSPLSSVNQVLIEIHLWTGSGSRKQFTKRWLQVFARLHMLGFRVFALHTNPMSTGTDWGVGRQPCCYEIGFVRVNQTAESPPQAID